ncbi:MAG: hypothetical protein U1F37_12585 [Alphaproteobacteria bacterium]
MNVVAPKTKRVNGIDVNYLMDTIDAVAAEPKNGIVGFNVKSAWKARRRASTPSPPTGSAAR